MFAVPLPDGSHAFGQAIALMMKNVVYCALTERRATTLAQGRPELTPASVVARVALSREQLDFGAWTALGVAPLVCRKSDFGNERFAGKGYVGAKIFDAALAQDFLAAFHGLAYWDSLHDPKYFDAWLVSPERKPATVRLRGASSTR